MNARLELPGGAFVLAMATLPEIGPARLNALVADLEPEAAWHEVLRGAAHRGRAAPLMGEDPAALSGAWARAASCTDVERIWYRHLEYGARVAWRDDDDYPAVLRDDPHGPALLVWAGSITSLDGPRVAIVGTRDCTRAGHDGAAELASELTHAGIRIVSGLALGIDAAAHSGALSSGDSPPIAVVGSGLDVVYPRRNAELWARVRDAGIVLTEHPLGADPVGWHFLARNRIIAALADVVVVVESHEHGGALQTANEAAARGVPVMAVPGSVRSPSSRGTNALIRDGASVCCDAADVLMLLGLVSASSAPLDTRCAPSADDSAVLEAIGWEPCGTEELMLRTGRSLGELALALDRLEDAGWIVLRSGWSERIGPVGKR